MKTTLATLSFCATMAIAGVGLADTYPTGNGGPVQASKPDMVAATSAKPASVKDTTDQMKNESVELQKMIDSSQAGGRIDPVDLDRAIQRSNQGF